MKGRRVNVEVLKELSTVEVRDARDHCLEDSTGGMRPGELDLLKRIVK